MFSLAGLQTFSSSWFFDLQFIIHHLRNASARSLFNFFCIISFRCEKTMKSHEVFFLLLLLLLAIENEIVILKLPKYFMLRLLHFKSSKVFYYSRYSAFFFQRLKVFFLSFHFESSRTKSPNESHKWIEIDFNHFPCSVFYFIFFFDFFFSFSAVLFQLLLFTKQNDILLVEFLINLSSVRENKFCFNLN